MWSIFYYHHLNALTIGTFTYAMEPGDIAFIPPGANCAHANWGDGCWCDFFRFELPAQTGIRSAIPHVERGLSSLLPNLRKASNKIVDSPATAMAFIWNLLWNVGQSPSLFRENEAIYLAEEFIRRNLGVKFSMDQLSDYCQVSQRTLLKLFRAEHGVTIQEFVLRKRVQEATRLLIKSELSIKEVAQKVGMSDLQYFNKTMRALTGLPPSKLRENSRNGE